jgi:long-chain acyl-CoA synthetase
MTLNLYDVFHHTARRQPDRPAVLGPGPDDMLTYAAADEAMRRDAVRLAAAGVGPGACVGLHCPSGARYILATYAAWRCGACVVPVPVELSSPEKEEILRTVALDFVISPTAAAAFLAPHRRGPEAELWPGTAAYSVARLRPPPAGFAAINAAFVRFTSGTTAAAKGVVLSHETIHERIHAANAALRLGPDDRVVWPLSMAYHFAVSIVGYLSFGAAIILPVNHFGQALLEASRRHRGTVVYGSPAHFAWMAAVPSVAPLPDLRLAISTTAGLDRAAADRFRERFGLPLVQALGIIEVGLPFINLADAVRRPEAVGRVLPAYELRLDDAGLGAGLGQILLRGPGFLDAYYHPWRPRSEVMPDGWFRSGDVGEMDADGCVSLRGRLTDVINVLGMKFFPQEVEAVLRSHPAVEDARVFSRPDPRLGEAPHAQVLLRRGAARPTEGELAAHCEKRLALFKTPTRIEFVDSLPRTASGKVLHRPAAAAEARRGGP